MKLPSPPTIIVRRNDRPRDRNYTPQFSERLPVNVEAETAPKPVDYSTFYGVGRDSAHAWGHIWRYQSLAIADKLSIAAQHFGVAKVPSALVVSQPRGTQNPVRERANIEPPQQITLGERSTVKSGLSYAPQYAKLI